MNKTKVAIIAVILSLIIVGIVYAIGGGKILLSTTSSSTSDYFYAPTFGTLRCQESDGTLTYPSSGYEMFDMIAINCRQFGSLVDECYVTFKLPSKDEVSGKDSFLSYRICDINDDNCDINQFANQLYARKSYLIA